MKDSSLIIPIRNYFRIRSRKKHTIILSLPEVDKKGELILKGADKAKYFTNLRATSFGFGWNIVREDTPKDLIEAFFPKREKILLFSSRWRWEEIGFALGLFDSKSAAKKSGWSGKISEGFNQKKVKKMQNIIYSYVPMEGML